MDKMRLKCEDTPLTGFFPIPNRYHIFSNTHYILTAAAMPTSAWWALSLSSSFAAVICWNCSGNLFRNNHHMFAMCTCSMAKPCILAWHHIKLMKHHKKNPNLQKLLARAWFKVNDTNLSPPSFLGEHFIFKKRKPSPSPSWTRKIPSPTFQLQPFKKNKHRYSLDSGGCVCFSHQSSPSSRFVCFPNYLVQYTTPFHLHKPDIFVALTILTTPPLGFQWASPLFPLQLVPTLFRLQKVPLVSHVVPRRPQVNSLRVSSELRTWFLGYGAIYIYYTHIYIYYIIMYNILPSLKPNSYKSHLKKWMLGWWMTGLSALCLQSGHFRLQEKPTEKVGGWLNQRYNR